MSFIKKFFFENKPQVTGGKKERSPRVRLLLGDGASLETSLGTFRLLNLSESGCGVLVENRQFPKTFEGTLVLGGESVNVGLEVARIDGDFVGIHFLGDTSPLRAALRRLFTEEIKATEMSEVDSSRLAKGEDGHPRWFYAPENYELFFLESKGKIKRFELEWNGRVVAAADGEPLRTGTIQPLQREKPDHSKSSLVNWDKELREDDKSKAVRILENIPGLDAIAREKLVLLIKDSS